MAFFAVARYSMPAASRCSPAVACSPRPRSRRPARAGPAQGIAGDRGRRRALGDDDAPLRRAGRRAGPGAHRGRADGERGGARVGRGDRGGARQPRGAGAFVFLVDRAQAEPPDERAPARLGHGHLVRRRRSGAAHRRASAARRRSRAIHARYEAGAVVGGTSAGAAIMSDSMITGDQTPPGDTTGYYGDEYPAIERHRIEVVPGLGFLPGAIVDQHFIRRERHNRLLSAVLERPAADRCRHRREHGHRGRARRPLARAGRERRDRVRRAAGPRHRAGGAAARRHRHPGAPAAARQRLRPRERPRRPARRR